MQIIHIKIFLSMRIAKDKESGADTDFYNVGKRTKSKQGIPHKCLVSSNDF